MGENSISLMIIGGILIGLTIKIGAIVDELQQLNQNFSTQNEVQNDDKNTML